jgi:hypothetical protein
LRGVGDGKVIGVLGREEGAGRLEGLERARLGRVAQTGEVRVGVVVSRKRARRLFWILLGGLSGGGGVVGGAVGVSFVQPLHDRDSEMCGTSRRRGTGARCVCAECCLDGHRPHIVGKVS